MEYNFEQNKLVMPEYGRHVLKMVEFLLTIEDRELRNKQALAVIDVMGNINSALRDTEEFKHKLWDHLFIISNFRLDVDSPYPKPSPEMINPKPKRPNYPQRDLEFKHYGRNVAKMIREVNGIQTDSPERQEAIHRIARYMKSKSQEFNNENINNETIMADIRTMSDSSINIESTILDNVRHDHKQRHKKNNKNPKQRVGAKHNNQQKQNRG
ncbi:MAG: DUF4290 domain-containing protein [Rikenellaceae bacterium]|nr:DUF4290 domain-containing protein [Rikenellaceae bacterium]MBO7213362.1 DUF4290 domain-containing protein [Rikenellaceae bacterium]